MRVSQRGLRQSSRIVVLWAVVLMLLTACTGTNIRNGYSLQADPGKGVVFGSILYDGMYSANWITIHRKGSGDSFPLSYGSPTLLLPAPPRGDFPEYGYDSLKHNGSLVSMALPPGDYEVVSWGVTSCGLAGRSCFAPAPFSISFSVKAGSATYIGSYKFLHRLVAFGIMGVDGVSMSDEFQRDQAVLARRFPNLHPASVDDAVAGLQLPMYLGASD